MSRTSQIYQNKQPSVCLLSTYSFFNMSMDQYDTTDMMKPAVEGIHVNCLENSCAHLINSITFESVKKVLVNRAPYMNYCMIVS